MALTAIVSHSTQGFAQEPAHCLSKYASYEQGCKEDLGKCKRHVQATGQKTSCDQQYAYCQTRWKQLINSGSPECFKHFKGPKPGTAVLKRG
jgi:hypothetical protein